MVISMHEGCIALLIAAILRLYKTSYELPTALFHRSLIGPTA